MSSLVLPRLSLELHEICLNNILVQKNVEFSLKKPLKIKYSASIYSIFSMNQCLNGGFDKGVGSRKEIFKIYF